MMRTVCISAFVLAFSGFVFGTSQDAQARSCAMVSASATAVTKPLATTWSQNRLKRQVMKWAQSKGSSTPRVGTTSTSCKPSGPLAFKTCTSSARACV